MESAHYMFESDTIKGDPSLKNRLEILRKQKGIKQEELAEALEVSRQTIGSLENGRYNPSIILAFKLARYFNTTIEEIFIYEEEKIIKINSQVKNYILVGISAGIIIGCLFAIKLYGRDIRIIIPLAIALLIFGHSVDNILKLFATKSSTKVEKQLEIEIKDERNTLIREKAGSETSEYMLYLNTVIVFILGFMGAEFWMLCLFGSLILAQGVLSVFLYNYYDNRY